MHIEPIELPMACVHDGAARAQIIDDRFKALYYLKEIFSSSLVLSEINLELIIAALEDLDYTSIQISSQELAYLVVDVKSAKSDKPTLRVACDKFEDGLIRCFNKAYEKSFTAESEIKRLDTIST